MVDWTLSATEGLPISKTIFVVNEDTISLKESYPKALFVRQNGTEGTAHALLKARNHVDRECDGILLLYGDTPLVKRDVLKGLLGRFSTGHRREPAAYLITTYLENPFGYGRIVRSEDSGISKIIEEREATSAQKEIREINTGIGALPYDIFSVLGRIGRDNKKGEYYLTDFVKYLKTYPVLTDPPADLLGVNTRVELAAATKIMQRRVIESLMLSGVTFINYETCTVDYDVKIGEDTVVHPESFLLKGTRIGRSCVIGPDVVISETAVGDDCKIILSHLQGAKVGKRVKIGPFSNLRPGTVLKDDVKIGNFVEVKKSIVRQKSKIPHLSYVGDAEVGSEVNIGAGTITCNYDGVKKHKTIIEDNAFIGSDTIIIAPRRIGEGSYIAAGSVINRDVPPGSLAIARSRQVNKLRYKNKTGKKKGG